MPFGDKASRRGTVAIALVVAAAMIASTAVAGVSPALVTDDDDDEDDGEFPPETDDYDDPAVDYDAIDLRLELEADDGDDGDDDDDEELDYEIAVRGAVEAANETAEDTVSCDDQECTIEGTLGEDERAAYNLSGAVTNVSPEEELIVHVNGTLEGAALLDLGSGALLDEADEDDESDERDDDSDAETDDDESDDGDDEESDGDADGDDEDDGDGDDEDDTEYTGDEDYVCDDFDTWDEAQEAHEESGGAYGLDADDDDVACESLPGAPDS